MSSDIDWNKVIAQVFVDLTKASLKGASGKVASTLSSLLQSFQKDFQPYLLSTLKRCSMVRTLLHREEPIELEKIYVKTFLKKGKSKLDDIRFINNLSSVDSVIITGTAGSGKSFFLKYLFISLFETRRSKIPVFVELRQMNSLQKRDLILFLYHSITSPGGVVSEAQFEQGLKNGLFTIILDGFDEIEFDWREDLEKQIFTFQEKYPKNQILISSRPDDRFQGWHSFIIFHVEPMAKKEVSSLIRKIDFDADVKKRFIKAMQKGMYDKHASFLSTPLLAIMMLLTFDQFASIPDKIHVFYDHAFDALFAKHDASKQGGYRRKSRSGLAIDDFKRCLSAFCAATYAKQKAVFSDTEMRAFLAQAFHFEKQTINIDDFIHDLIEFVCILQRDGLFLTFSHRSFQEYFTAYFICRSPTVDLSRLLDQLMKRLPDSVLPMSFDMNRNLLERQWILPKLNVLCETINKIPKEKLFDYIDLFYIRASALWTNNSINIMVGEFRDWGLFRVWLYRFYTSKFDYSENRVPRTTRDVFEDMRNRCATPTARELVIQPLKDTLVTNFELVPSIDECLQGTWLSRYIEAHRRVFFQLKDEVSLSVAEQHSILEQMFETSLLQQAQ
jgi:hypothetical protein